jgi:hypothetical protein
MLNIATSIIDFSTIPTDSVMPTVMAGFVAGIPIGIALFALWKGIGALKKGMRG